MKKLVIIFFLLCLTEAAFSSDAAALNLRPIRSELGRISSHEVCFFQQKKEVLAMAAAKVSLDREGVKWMVEADRCLDWTGRKKVFTKLRKGLEKNAAKVLSEKVSMTEIVEEGEIRPLPEVFKQDLFAPFIEQGHEIVCFDENTQQAVLVNLAFGRGATIESALRSLHRLAKERFVHYVDYFEAEGAITMSVDEDGGITLSHPGSCKDPNQLFAETMDLLDSGEDYK